MIISRYGKEHAQKRRTPRKDMHHLRSPFCVAKKWANNWDEVKYCSKACRTQRPGDLEERLEQAIIELINVRGTRATICPSEAARSVAPEAWKPLMGRHAKRHDAWPIVEWSRLPNEANASSPQDFEDPFA